jgi:hypothetical protein
MEVELMCIHAARRPAATFFGSAWVFAVLAGFVPAFAQPDSHDHDDATMEANPSISTTSLPVTVLCGHITSDKTCSKDTVYVVNCHLYVDVGVTLTLPAGTIFKFDRSALYVNGTLDLQGTEAEPVYMTSYHDDSVGGDSDGSATTPAAGDWYYVQYTNGENSVEHAVFRYAGGHWNVPTALWLSNCAVDVTDCSFADIQTNSLYSALYGSYSPTAPTSQTIARNTFNNCSYGIRLLGGTYLTSLVRDNTVT